MAGGKKQKVTGFTQAEQELLAVSVEKYSKKNREKILKFFSEKKWNFKKYFENFFRALADLRLARDRLFSGFMLSTLSEFQFGSKLEFINIQ